MSIIIFLLSLYSFYSESKKIHLPILIFDDITYHSWLDLTVYQIHFQTIGIPSFLP